MRLHCFPLASGRSLLGVYDPEPARKQPYVGNHQSDFRCANSAVGGAPGPWPGPRFRPHAGLWAKHSVGSDTVAGESLVPGRPAPVANHCWDGRIINRPWPFSGFPHLPPQIPAVLPKQENGTCATPVHPRYWLARGAAQANYLDIGNDPFPDHRWGLCVITAIHVRSYLGSKRSAGAWQGVRCSPFQAELGLIVAGGLGRGPQRCCVPPCV